MPRHSKGQEETSAKGYSWVRWTILLYTALLLIYGAERSLPKDSNQLWLLSFYFFFSPNY